MPRPRVGIPAARAWEVPVRRIIALAVLATLSGSIAAAQADAGQAEDVRRWRIAVFVGQWWEVDLPQAPFAVLTADVDLRDAYYLAGNVNYNLLPAGFRLPFWGFADGIPFAGLELDAQFIDHGGVDDDREVSAAFAVRSRDLSLGPVRVNGMVGEGLSYVFGALALEKGAAGRRGQGQKRLQNHLVFEIEGFLAGRPAAALALRLHHRSGVYGLFSSSETGSNWLSLGLRTRF